MRVAIIMGSTSDLPKVEPAINILKEHGVKEIAIHLTGERAPAGIHGKCDTSEVAHYFEKIADKFGIQMEHAREKFDYEFLKVQHQKLIERYTK